MSPPLCPILHVMKSYQPKQPQSLHPTRLHIVVTSLLLIGLSLIVSPVTLLLTSIVLLRSRLDGTALHLRKRASHCKTVLITGGRTNKCLVLLRAFRREGHRVIVAEEGSWGRLACTRFSRAVDKYYSLPEPITSPGKVAYKRSIASLIAREGVDVWIPCSSIFATADDAEAALAISLLSQAGAHKPCDTFIQHPDLIDNLHWKDRFMRLCLDLGFQIPESQLITSPSQGIEFLYGPRETPRHSYILKCVDIDDVGRSDLTLLPLETREATIAHFAKMPVQPSEKCPFVLQRYIGGPEYCTHGVVRDGRLVAFVASRSSDMVLRYVDLESYSKPAALAPERNRVDHAFTCRFEEEMWQEREVGKQAEEWTVEFLDRWKKLLAHQGRTGKEAELTGHFSFDFLLEQAEGTLYPIECNPRAHTAVALLSENPRLASAYLGRSGDPMRPADAVPRSWLSHALPLSIANLIPSAIASIIFPLLHPRLVRSSPLTSNRMAPENATLSPFPDDGPLSVVSRHLAGLEKDVSFDVTDPLPFFILAHIQLPLILMTLMLRGRRWSRINASTARVYEC